VNADLEHREQALSIGVIDLTTMLAADRCGPEEACSPEERDFRPLSASLAARSWIQAVSEGAAMYEKILAAIDESDVSGRVLAAASELAALSHGEICVLHLREREMSKFGAPPAESSGEAHGLVDEAVQKLTSAGITAVGIIRDSVFGYAAREIISEADRQHSGVIVMGSRGRGDLAGLLVGSTTHKVIHLADRPVLVVR
jgi:nucleotide-binding universal stress UspA family protein